MYESGKPIGFWSAVLLGMGAMIGAGIFALLGQAGADVLLVGYDSGRENVTPIAGYPDFLYTVVDAPDLKSWIEMMAREYLEKVGV